MCKADGGNPLAEISWYKNGIKVDSSYTTSGRDSSNTYSFLASSKDNNAKFRCESKNELSTEPLMAEIVLSVNCKFWLGYSHHQSVVCRLMKWNSLKCDMKRQVFGGGNREAHFKNSWLNSADELFVFLNVKTYTFFKKISAVDRCKYKPK